MSYAVELRRESKSVMIGPFDFEPQAETFIRKVEKFNKLAVKPVYTTIVFLDDPHEDVVNLVAEHFK